MSSDPRRQKLNIGRILERSWKPFRTKYYMNVLVVILIGIIVGGYTFNTRFVSIGRSTTIQEEITTINTGNSNIESVEDFLKSMEIIQVDPEMKTVGKQYTKGVFSVFVNQISHSGSFAFGILNGINKLLFKDSVSRSVVIFSAVLLVILFTIFFQNVLLVGQCRYFLEHRRYADTKADALLFVFRHGRTRHVAKIMLVRDLLLILWGLTIVGGFVKTYQYAMIPYILAENPDIGLRDAFKLSKQLSKGNKWRMFVVDVIYGIGFLLSPFTFNMLSVFLVNPLHQCARAEIYSELRDSRKELTDKGAELLNDRMLAVANVSGSVYPESAFPIPVHRRRRWLTIDYDRRYTFWTIVMFFFTYSLVGYVWEVFYTLLNEGLLVNRGTMTGPWLPIYGVGGLIIVIILRPLRRNPLLMFTGTFVACGALEYFASWMLETLFDAKWWDYKGYFLNINGRVCLEGLLIFGLAGVAFTYVFSPLLDNLYSKIRLPVKRAICVVLMVLFVIDMAYSFNHPNQGDGVTYGEEGMGADIAVIEEDQV